ncbi:MAG: hypothetical protein IT371_01700 [Deltaproteobacteria bacterium]|nr:hypothetical protein [Deltaproteobacteria bacterium]
MNRQRATRVQLGRGRKIGGGLALVVAGLAACGGDVAPPSSGGSRWVRAARSIDGGTRTDGGARSDASTDAGAASCGVVPAEGCCLGNVLYYCATAGLRRLDCRARPACGWRTHGYDCDTGGGADPTGTFGRECRFGDGGVPGAPDAGSSGDGGGCRGVPLEGCCAQEALYYCDEGRLVRVSCFLNRRCGWRGTGQYYECGTTGEPDPSGRYPKACPGPGWDAAAAVPDGGVSPRRDAGAETSPGGGDGGSGGGAGCACEVPTGGTTEGLTPLWALAWWLRRRSCAPRRRRG